MIVRAQQFFEELGRQGHDHRLAKVTGRVRFDVVDGGSTDSWIVAIQRGDLSVSHDPGAADCTIRGDKALFDALADGRANAMSAVLRGALSCTGDVELLIAVQRVFPDPPRESPTAGGARGAP